MLQRFQLENGVDGVQAEVGAVGFDERCAPDVGADEAIGLRYPLPAEEGVAQWIFYRRDEAGIRQIKKLLAKM